MPQRRRGTRPDTSTNQSPASLENEPAMPAPEPDTQSSGALVSAAPQKLPTSLFDLRLPTFDYRSCPQYDRLKLLLHSGKSETCWSRRAMASPVQLWKEGSTIL